MTLKTTAEWTLRRRLLAVPGIAEVIPTGRLTKQYQVQVQPERMAAYGLTLEQVIDAVRRTNQTTSGGFLVENQQEFLIHARGRVQSLEDIATTIVTQREGVPVLVRDLAEVKIAPAARRGTGSYKGQGAVILVFRSNLGPIPWH